MTTKIVRKTQRSMQRDINPNKRLFPSWSMASWGDKLGGIYRRADYVTMSIIIGVVCGLPALFGISQALACLVGHNTLLGIMSAVIALMNFSHMQVYAHSKYGSGTLLKEPHSRYRAVLSGDFFSCFKSVDTQNEFPQKVRELLANNLAEDARVKIAKTCESLWELDHQYLELRKLEREMISLGTGVDEDFLTGKAALAKEIKAHIEILQTAIENAQELAKASEKKQLQDRARALRSKADVILSQTQSSGAREELGAHLEAIKTIAARSEL